MDYWPLGNVRRNFELSPGQVEIPIFIQSHDTSCSILVTFAKRSQVEAPGSLYLSTRSLGEPTVMSQLSSRTAVLIKAGGKRNFFVGDKNL